MEDEAEDGQGEEDKEEPVDQSHNTQSGSVTPSERTTEKEWNLKGGSQKDRKEIEKG